MNSDIDSVAANLIRSMVGVRHAVRFAEFAALLSMAVALSCVMM